MSRDGDLIHVESWELSPRNQAVITTVGRLQRRFPGPTLSLGLATFKEPGLRESLAHTLAKMSHQPAPGTKPKVKKDRQKHDEDRDTSHPKLVTELFMAFLRPLCDNVEALQIQKSTREEVMWLNSRSPWRRSSLWLLVRVTLQLVLRRLSLRDRISEDLYKQFMIYFMSSIVDLSSGVMSSEHLYVMTAKISRRLLKLDLSEEPAWFTSVRGVLHRASNAIRDSRDSIIAKNSPRLDLQPLKDLVFVDDIQHTLFDLDRYIEGIHERESRLSQLPADFQPHSSLLNFPSTVLPTRLHLSDPEYATYNLTAFEDWVASNLDVWLLGHIAEEVTCHRLGELIKSYHGIASRLYSPNPEAVSTMLLTILELWIACDKSATHLYGMLSDYDACIPMDTFQSLLLPFHAQMTRLACAEDYLRQRQKRLVYSGPGIFRDFGTRLCFSVQYFNQSDEHRALHTAIEERASRDRRAKQTELHQKHEKYRQLTNLADESECTYYEVVVDNSSFRESRHSPSCPKHEYLRQADAISINIHEWPLPKDDLQAKSTVFELKLPRPFGCWRDTTIFFLLDVLQVDYASQEKPRAMNRPQTYYGLSSFFTPADGLQRIGLLSQDKPHERTHRRQKKVIYVTEGDICLDNGMHFKYFDNSKGCFVSGLTITRETATSCTYKLPQTGSSLQQFLFRPPDSPDGLSPNTVISSQNACPVDMSLDEYRNLCIIPLGVEIQWQNILLQLTMPSVDFKKVDTCIFILQVINQVGPSYESSIIRQGHAILNDPVFAATMLDEIEKAAGRIQENWEMSHGLNALVFLTLRILSLSTSTDIHNICLDRLRCLRRVAFKWVKLVNKQANTIVDAQHRNGLIARNAQLALICMETFDSEDTVLEQILAAPSDASIFIQCCMMIYDRKLVLSMKSDPLLPILYRRWQVLTYRCYPILTRNIVCRGQSSLNIAIKQTWAAYRTGSVWSVAPEGASYWLVSQTASQTIEGRLLVHYNLLTGALLINGLPLAQLPSEYERHETYGTLFGQSLLEVMPSDVPGMQFSCQREHVGHAIHLGKERIPNSTQFDLCVRAAKLDRVYEFIPPRLLAGAFPDAFVEDYAHWYDLDGRNVEFRSIKEPWLPSGSSWRLQKTRPRNEWCLIKDGVSLISVSSPTAKLMSNILEPIEKPLKLHCSFHPASSALEIDLPRLRLGFDLRSGDTSIRSRQYRGMSIDADQSLGALVGLRNKLLLLHENSQDRVVLIPEGTVSWNQVDEHVAVNIARQAVTNLHVYSVDPQLGRLADNGSLQSKLVLCYLHALTSFCIPDPLTGKTGTEQALSILRSASMRSFDHLQTENGAVLVNIAKLTPERTYYPANERVMQTVQWQNNLGSLAQHNSFYEEVTAIFDQDRRMQMFYPDIQMEHPLLPHVEGKLLKRDRIRSATFRVAEFGAEDHTSKRDHRYPGLDRGHNSPEASRAFTLSKIVYEELPSVRRITTEDLVSHLWGFLSKTSSTHGQDAPIDAARMKYDAGLILEPNTFISQYWSSIHRIICSEGARFDKFQLMMWLSTMAFSKDADMLVLETLASIYVVADMASVLQPSRVSFQLGNGYQLNKRILKSRMGSVVLLYTPESDLSPHAHETYTQFKSRKKMALRKNRAEVLDGFIRNMESQWPNRSPLFPAATRFKNYFDPKKAMTQVQGLFSTWLNNQEFRGYLSEIALRFSCQTYHLVETPSYSVRDPEEPVRRKRGFICIDDLLGHAPIINLKPPQLLGLVQTCTLSDEPAPRLLALLDVLESQSKSNYEKGYVKQLQSSVRSLDESQTTERLNGNASDVKKAILDYLDLCEGHSSKIYATILSRMTASSGLPDPISTGNAVYSKVLAMVADLNQWSRLSPNILLKQLTRHRWHKLTDEWKATFVSYGSSITMLQRAKRMAGLAGDWRATLIAELQNPGHSNWDPLEFPETLLLEIENGILIRNVQEQIARQMRDFSPGGNAVMQLNMGEGKSSVIVPIVAAALANETCLVRVLVAKPQSRQMFHMLVSKLGGLLDRRVYHMPVSRSLKPGETEADEIGRMCRECMENGGVLLVQPEHILSLKLMCLECFISGKTATGHSLLRTLEFFQTSSRDVVDESDENFSVKFELIYTMGVQRPLELSPERWVVIQQMLDLVRKYAPGVKQMFPQSIEVDERWHGGFPRIRLLRDDAQQELFRRISTDIGENGTNSLPVSRQPQGTREAVLTYALNAELTECQIAAIESEGRAGFWTDSTKGPLLLVRGLLAGGVLAFCFRQKRWRVNYGPDQTRNPPTKLSVPYRAKDSPAPRSEFSHPDIVITLTSLSYYYAGLGDDDLILALNHLVKSDQADTEYRAWVDDAPILPPEYHHLVGLNLEDRHHCRENIFPYLRFSKNAVDYFLAHIVFSKEMKEFPEKLSASGWDVGEIKAHPTVGFSGTNDSRETLPLSVEQLDLPEQNHTNALVLEYLLQPENSVAFISACDEPFVSDAQNLLNIVAGLDPSAQVILDVGAQILELNNLEVAATWLRMKSDDGHIQAVVYVNDRDELCVLDRNQRVELLQTSPFAKRLEVCLVFLDEAHTRGIDLKLPPTYRAAVTLGAGITKDKLVQGKTVEHGLSRKQTLTTRYSMHEDEETG